MTTPRSNQFTLAGLMGILVLFSLVAAAVLQDSRVAQVVLGALLAVALILRVLFALRSP